MFNLYNGGNTGKTGGGGTGNLSGTLTQDYIPIAFDSETLVDSPIHIASERLVSELPFSIADGIKNFLLLPSAEPLEIGAAALEGMILRNSISGTIQVYENGEWRDITGGEYLRTDEYWVSDSKGDDTTGNGSRTNPYKTLQYTINTHCASSAHDVIYVDHSSTEDLVFNNIQNVTIIGTGVLDSQQTSITGNHTISGTSARIRFKDITLIDAADDYIITYNGSSGSHTNQNVTLSVGAADKAILFTGANSSWHAFYDCSIGGIVDCQSSVPTMSVTFSRQLSQDFVLNMTNYTIVGLGSCVFAKQINHSFGYLGIDGLSQFSGTTTGNYGIVSTAPAASVSSISLKNVNMYNIGGYFSLINKTGDCPYVLDTVARDPDNDIFLAGTKGLVENAVDINGNYTPSNYTPADDSVTGHLEGIDDALISGVSSSIVTEQITIAFDDETNFTLSTTPISNSSVLLSLNGLAMQINVDYSVSGTSLTWLDNDGVTLKTTDDLVARMFTAAVVEDYIPLSYLDTDDTLAADSDTKVPSQKATKAYVDNKTVNATKSFFMTVNEPNSNYENRRVLGISATGNGRFNLYIPKYFNTVTNISLVFFNDNANSLGNFNFTAYSTSADGQSSTANLATKTITEKLDDRVPFNTRGVFDITDLFPIKTGGVEGGVLLEQGAIGGTVLYLGIEITGT